MNKLTEEQKLKIQNKNTELQEKFLAKNKSILFDIKKVTDKSNVIRAELNNLNLTNELVKMQVKQQFDTDVKKIREFLGEYADAVIVSEDDRLGNLYYSIGVNDNNKVFVTYCYGKEDFKDWNNYVEIDGHKYQKYVAYEIDTYADGYNNEYHRDFEAMFNDADVVEMFEIAVQDYIVYHKKDENKLGDKE